jgi:hypothetical protein
LAREFNNRVMAPLRDRLKLPLLMFRSSTLACAEKLLMTMLKKIPNSNATSRLAEWCGCHGFRRGLATARYYHNLHDLGIDDKIHSAFSGMQRSLLRRLRSSKHWTRSKSTPCGSLSVSLKSAEGLQ